MRYIDHIRNMSDDQLAYFLNAIQPEITLWSFSMMRALSRKPYKGVDALNGTNGDTRTLMSILYKDYDYEMKLMDEERNQSLDDLHDYASGNDLKRALGHPELQKKRDIVSGKWGSGKISVGECEYYKHDEYFRTAWNFYVIAWMPMPAPYKAESEE